MMKYIKKIIKGSILYRIFFKIKNPEAYRKAEKIADIIVELNEKLDEKGVRLIFLLPPDGNKIDNLSAFARRRIENWTFDFNNITPNDAEIIQQLYTDETVETLIKKYEGAKVIEKNGYKVLTDFENEYVHIINGSRITPGQPDNYRLSIHIYGACTVRGTGVSDGDTISGYLQKKLNDRGYKDLRCVNHGIGCGSSVLDDIHCVNNTLLYKGDILFICNLLPYLTDELMKKRGVEIWDSSKAFSECEGVPEWFTDLPVHTNKAGNEAIAGYIAEELSEKGYIEKNGEKGKLIGCIKPDEILDQEWIDSEEFKGYIARLMENKPSGKDNGAIVMNCNPFTLGHRYLIESAAAAVDELYIFVVEEDRSYFPFEDRFELVKKGTEDLKNVHVLKSGKFIISAVTFPGYFYKDYDKEAIVDTSKDVDLFARYIAPTLNIKTRFAGEEPLDPITRQYNETMAERLPIFGIKFVEIKRKADDKNVISASRVREALKRGDWELISSLVPKTTYEYLIERFG